MADRIASLPTLPTARNPFGLRYAVQERAAILITHDHADEADADALAWELEIGGGQRALFGGEP